LTISNIVVTESDTNGIELYSNVDVNVDNSRFDRNQQTGALIRAGRNVNVRNSAFGNGNTFTDRIQIDGLDIVSGQSTSLFGVIANDNYEFGANIQSTGQVTIANSVFNGQQDQGTSDTGEAMFRGYGLNVVTPDSIALLNVTANNNYLWGAMLNAGGDIAIQDSTFNANSTNQPGFIDDTGLFITGGQNVALNNVTASENRLFGAQINVEGTVSINDSNFNDNVGVTTINGVTNYYGTGVQVTTLADIFINGTNATGNSLFGGQMNASGEVAVSNSNFSNTSTTVPTAVLGKGLEVVSGGNISLTNTILNNNQTLGADIQAGGDIFLDTVTATDNGTDGIAIQQGICTHVTGGTYSGNGQYGLNLGSSPLDLVSPPIFANNGSGDIFPATPVTCTSPVSNGGTPGTTGGSTTGGTPAVNGTSEINGSAGSSQLFTNADYTVSANASLNSFLANTRTGMSSIHGIFIGQYAYVDSINGLQIIALDPVSQDIAMSGSTQ
jgi:hypothetical protein